MPLSPLPDIDSADLHNPLAAAEYANSIYDYYRRVEPKFSVPHDYMKSQVGNCYPSTQQLIVQAIQLQASTSQPSTTVVLRNDLQYPLQVEINEKMRGILIDWLVEVHLKFKVGCCFDGPAAPSQSKLNHFSTSSVRSEPCSTLFADTYLVCFLQLMPETLYLTCNIIDRYLAIRNVTRKRLQLVSGCCTKPH